MNFENLSKIIDNFIHEIRIIIKLNRFRKIEIINNIMIDKIDYIYYNNNFIRMNFRLLNKRFDYNINILKIKLIN